jgi:mRNA-degrading endonuclease RelE of RelBE toxin-antitoxin system
MSESTPWKIVFFDDGIKTEYDTYFERHPEQDHVRINFEKDVTENPLYHPTPKKIVPLKGRYKGQYRYRKSSTRIVYEPDQSSKTVYPLETNTATGISYKKKSKKK